MKNLVLAQPFGSDATSGMTKRQAGNFRFSQPETCQGLVFAREILRLLGKDSHDLKHPRVFVMDGKEHTSKVRHWKDADRMYSQHICDGVIWSGPGLALCFPGGCPVIAFRSTDQAQLFGMVHCSWKTIGQRIVTNFLTQWQFLGGSPAKTKVQFFPAICRGCLLFDYQYWHGTVSPAISWAHPNPHLFSSRMNNRIGLDLFALLTTILKGAGYSDILDDEICTCCSGEYWCYRHHDSKEVGGEKYRNAAFLLAESLPHLA